MATQRREVSWTLRARDALDDAAAHIALDSPNAVVDLVESALAAAESLDTLSERGHIVPELEFPTVREIFIDKYRLIYQVTSSRVTVIGFLPGARDFNQWWRGEGTPG